MDNGRQLPILVRVVLALAKVDGRWQLTVYHGLQWTGEDNHGIEGLDNEGLGKLLQTVTPFLCHSNELVLTELVFLCSLPFHSDLMNLSRPDLDRRKSLISLEGLKTVTKNEIIEQPVGEEQAQTMTTKIVSGELSQEVLR